MAVVPAYVDKKNGAAPSKKQQQPSLIQLRTPTSKDALGAGREGRPRLLGATLAKRVSAE